MTTLEAFPRPSCPLDNRFDPFGPEYLADPIAVLRRLPADHHPVFYASRIGYYVVTRWAEAEQVFRNPELFSAANVQDPLVPLEPAAQRILHEAGYRPGVSTMDPPEHERLRGPIQRAFTPGRVWPPTTIGTEMSVRSHLRRPVGFNRSRSSKWMGSRKSRD